ncbi:MAG: rod shape-determining protein MreC [Betaproteobacteria bacterium]|nr:rod shape-determining protein MreC [Betaproteobacteria bacterium]
MSVVGHQPPPFFNRGPAPLARLAFFVALSLLLLVLDLRFHTLELVRQGVALITYPMQRLAYAPEEAFGRWDNYLTSLAALEQENAELRQKQLTTARLLLRQEHLEQENQRLRALLDMKQRQPVTSQVAEILYAARDPFSRRVVLDKGTRQNIAAGQVVVDELGVIGQVTRAFPMISEATLITDKDQAVPVQIVRNGLRSVLFGTGDGNLELRFLAANADVQAGDVLVTSGLDDVYLPGLPVAKVTRVDRDTTYAFARILCEPIAGVERHGQVLVLGPREAPPPPPPAVETQDKPDKGRKGKRKE